MIEALVLAKPIDAVLFVEPSVTLNDDTFVEPDLAIWPRSIESQDVRGPDMLLVVEVSSSSISYDLRVKARLYAAHDIREYWVVDALRKTIRVHRAPEAGRYCDVAEYGAHEAVGPVLLPGVSIQLDKLD